MSTTYLPARAGRHHAMIDGDHVAKASVNDARALEVFEVARP